MKLIYTLEVSLREGACPEGSYRQSAPVTPYNAPQSAGTLRHPIVIGAGPAGLFCAYLLALAGAEPIILERGQPVDVRGADIDAFYASRILNPESNLLFGEGGAGTWSDGKLFTRIRDPRIAYVLETFVSCGASPQTAYFAHPHLGSDRLPGIISRLREAIIRAGGKFCWGSRVRELIISGGRCGGAVLTTGERIEAPAVIAAAGHSARDFIERLIGQGVGYSLKGFQIGARIEHPQRFINQVQYRMAVPPPAVGAAEYSYSVRPLTESTSTGAATFCMCPGGEVLPATAAPGRLSTNGMSNAERSGKFANSALITTIPAENFASPQEAFNFLDAIEAQAFTVGGGNYGAPAQTAAAFLRGEKPALDRSRGTSFRMGLTPARLDQLLPAPAVAQMRRLLQNIERSARGFVREGLLIGPETRVSSPVRFNRNPNTLETTLPGFYACGEGAGLAGGITSSAVDGMKIAEAAIANA